MAQNYNDTVKNKHIIMHFMVNPLLLFFFDFLEGWIWYCLYAPLLSLSLFPPELIHTARFDPQFNILSGRQILLYLKSQRQILCILQTTEAENNKDLLLVYLWEASNVKQQR